MAHTRAVRLPLILLWCTWVAERARLTVPPCRTRRPPVPRGDTGRALPSLRLPLLEREHPRRAAHSSIATAAAAGPSAGPHDRSVSCDDASTALKQGAAATTTAPSASLITPPSPAPPLTGSSQAPPLLLLLPPSCRRRHPPPRSSSNSPPRHCCLPPPPPLLVRLLIPRAACRPLSSPAPRRPRARCTCPSRSRSAAELGEHKTAVSVRPLRAYPEGGGAFLAIEPPTLRLKAGEAGTVTVTLQVLRSGAEISALIVVEVGAAGVAAAGAAARAAATARPRG